MPPPMLGDARAYALSPIQEGLLFHSLYAPGAGHYVVQMRVRLGRLDREAFKHAWQRVADRHEILRTAFISDAGGDSTQAVQPVLRLQWDEHDWRALDEPERRLEDYVARDRARDFDFSQAPLMRLALIAVAEGVDEFIWTFHHAILDGWSVPLVLAEVVGFYRAGAQGRELSLPAPRPFRDYIGWLEKQDKARAEAFWRDALRGLTAPTTLAPARGAQADEQTGEPAGEQAGAIATRGVEERVFSTDLTARVRAFAGAHGLTVNTIVQGIWAILLGRYSGESHVVFGAAVAGRPADLAGVESMIGLFINTLPIVARIRDDMRIVDWLKEFQGRQVEARRFEYTPQAKLHEWSGLPQQLPLFESFLAFENYPILNTLKQRSAAGPDVLDLRVSEQAHYPLVLTLVPERAARLRLNYDRRRFDTLTVANALRHFEALLTAMVSDADGRVGTLEMFTPAETAGLREQAQGAIADYPSRCLHELIEAQVDRTPNAIAVTHGAAEITCAELDRRANQLAHHLMARGVSPGSIVGICLPRSIDLIVALLATLKTGATYVPIDPDSLRLRIVTMIGDAGPAMVITHEHLAAIVDAGTCPVLALDLEQPSIASASTERPRVPTDPARLAYVMYTSGSTGTPKGVMVSHGSLVNYIWFAKKTYDGGDALTAAFYSSVSFDLTVTSMYVPLVSGGRIDISDARADGSCPIHDIVAADRVHLLKATPSHLALLKERQSPNRRLRCIVVGGEALSTALAAETQNGLAAHPAIINEYGPTEATVGCTTHVFDAARDTGSFVPIGRPLSNLQTYVIDRGGRLCPPGAIGEIYIGGDGIAEGYWRRPAQTAERFVPHPFSGRPGARLYRSGDFGYWQPDGVLAYVGRRDHQVKYHGHRVELNEIRVALNAHPSIHDSVVVLRRDDEDARLIAYYVADVDLEAASLREHLSTRIVRETMPNAFVRIAVVPLTRNGKIDDAALPEPGRDAAATARTFVAPDTEIERDLCEIWAAVLRRERVGVTDDYFDLGGDSVKSIQIASRAQRRGVALAVRDLFEHPTVAALTRELERRTRDAATQGDASTGSRGDRIAPSAFALAPRERGELEAVIARYPDAEDVYPLSPAQEGILFHTLQAPGSGVYLTQVALRLSGVEPGLLEQAWAQVIARHAILRTAMVYEGVDTPVQVVRRALDMPWVREDWRHLDDAAHQARLREYLRGVADRGLALGEAPIMKLALMEVDRGEHLFVWSYHHILLDGWSVALVLSEVSECYAAARAGREPRLQAPRPYRDYLAWLQAQDAEDARRFWTDALADVAEPTVLALPAPAPNQRPDGDPHERQQRTLPRGLSDRLRTFAHAHHLTLNTLVQGAWALVLSQYSAAEMVVFGMVIAGRPAGLPDVEAIPGLFINTVPLKIRVTPDATVRAWLGDVQAQQVGASAWGHVALSRIQAYSAVPRGTPLFETIFTFDNYPRLARQEAGVRVSPIGTHAHVHYPCAVAVTPGEEITLAIGYDAARFARDTITQVLAQFEHTLCELAADPRRRIADLSTMSPADERQVLIDWNATARPFSHDRCMHHLIEAQVERTPDAVALVSGSVEVTYRDLNVRANRVAHRLRGLGVRPDASIAVSLPRSVDLVVALLGVLKADGAYVPIDPDLPAARRDAILADTAAPVIVTQARWREAFAGQAATVLCIDDPDADLEARLDARLDRGRDDNPLSRGGPDHAIYVLYTSGSTGVPKGVTNVHRGVINRLEWMRDAYGIGPGDRILQKTPYTFDFSACELFLPLISGATMVIAGPDDHRDPAVLARLIREARVTMVHFVPSMLAMFLEVPGVETLDSLRWLFSGGEALGRDVMETFQARMPCPLVNVYGPTEAAIDVTAWPCAEPTPHDQVPIGRPIDNIRMYILDRRFRPSPPGAPGELCIGGVGLARGYCHRAGQTAERFVPDPFGEAGDRLYRTGDLARHANGGAIEFLGRSDAQVKIRGFRIELGEIEAALRALPEVREAAVVVSKGPQAPRLIAFVVPHDLPYDPPHDRPGDALSSRALTDRLRPQLAATLPDYMVPSRIVAIDAVPRTTSGKVDRIRLLAVPLPDANAAGNADEYVRPETALEQRLAAVWREVLHVERVGRHDNFFELGGDSILSIQVVARLHKRGVQTTVADLFEHPTVAALAAVASVASVAVQEAIALPAGGIPLTPIQQRFFEQQRANPHHYNQAVLLAVDHLDLDLDRVERIVASWQAGHEALRLRYHCGPSGWSATALDRETHRVATLVDLSAIPAANWGPIVERVATSLQASLHLSDGPLLRAALIRGGAHGDRLLLVVHHLAIDAVSWRLLLDDWAHTLSAPDGESLPAAAPFRAWARALAEYAQTPTVAADAEYWLAKARPTAPLRLDDPDGAHTVALGATISIALRADETRGVLQDAKRQGVSVHELLVAAVAGAVAGSMGSADVRLDVEGHGRDAIDAIVDGIDVSRTVGWFTTIYPVVLHLPETATTVPAAAWHDVLATVVTQLRAIPNHGASYGLLRYLHGDAALREALAAAPQARIRFNHLGQVDQDLAGGGVRLAPESIGPWQDPAEQRAYEIEVLSKIVGGVLTIEWTYSPARLSTGTMQTIAARGHSLLLAGTPRARLAPSDFPLAALETSELDALIARYPDLEDIYPLAPVQHGLLFHTLYAPGSGVYVPQMSVRLSGLDVDAFQRAWALAIERHAILRTAFVQDDLQRPVQVVRRLARATWEMEDWRACDPAAQRERAQAYLDRVRRVGVAFGDAPMMKLALARVDGDEYYFFWTSHHALLDAWSTRLLLEEVNTSYQAFREEREPLLRPARPYRDYIAWLRGQDAAEVSRFWEHLLADAPCTVLADPHASADATTTTATTATAAATPAAPHAGKQTLQISGELTQRLQTLARHRGLTLNTLLQAAWALVLAHETGASEVTFGITVSGRPAELPDVESLIGNLIHTVPLRVAMPSAITVRDCLDGIFARNTAMRRYEHATIAPNRMSRASEALFNSILVFQNVPGSLTLDRLQGVQGSEHMTVERTHYPLSLIVIPARTGLLVELGYDAVRFTQPWIARILSLLEVACSALMTTPDGTLQEALRMLARHDTSAPAAGPSESTRSTLKRTRRQRIVGVAGEVKS